MDQNRKRTAEYKEALEIAENAKNAEDLFEEYSPIDLKPEHVLIIVADEVKK